MRRPELARKRAAEPADYQGKQRVTDSHEILGRSPPTRNDERSAQLDWGGVLEPQDLSFRTCLENEVSIPLRLVVANMHRGQHRRAQHKFECWRRLEFRLAELFFFGRTNHAAFRGSSLQEVVERQDVGAHAVEIQNDPHYI